MIIHMRTTLVLQDYLVREAKKRAAERNLTVSDVVNEALRAALMDPPEKAQPYVAITFGQPDGKARHEPADFYASLEEEDRERLR
jgi:hypothetical protein